MPESRAVTHAVALARQPIFDREDRLHGYELLSRDSPLENRAVARPGVSPTAMSSDTITRAFLDLGIADVTHGRLAFLNVDRTMLLDGSVEVLDPRTVVLELLETIACDPEVLAACTTLVAKGYTLALDDFVYDETYDPLLRLVRIVTIDTLGRSDAELRDVLAKVHPFGVRRLAERVESAADHARCLALGFDLFQGYFYARPEMLSGQRVPTQQARLIRLLNLLRDSHASDALVEAEFRADPKLSYQLLRIVNSAGVGHSGVTSIGHALRLLAVARCTVGSGCFSSPPARPRTACAAKSSRPRSCARITARCSRRRPDGVATAGRSSWPGSSPGSMPCCACR
jgi:EAL and modified HD-GYP domain-containing signal transduction protein